MSTKGVAVIPEITPGETLASYIFGSWMYQDRAAACHVWVGRSPAAVTESSSGGV